MKGTKGRTNQSGGEQEERLLPPPSQAQARDWCAGGKAGGSAYTVKETRPRAASTLLPLESVQNPPSSSPDRGAGPVWGAQPTESQGKTGPLDRGPARFRFHAEGEREAKSTYSLGDLSSKDPRRALKFRHPQMPGFISTARSLHVERDNLTSWP